MVVSRLNTTRRQTVDELWWRYGTMMLDTRIAGFASTDVLCWGQLTSDERS